MTGSDVRTLGPFVYYNQYAAFIEAVLPIALVRAILDPAGGVYFTVSMARCCWPRWWRAARGPEQFYAWPK